MQKWSEKPVRMLRVDYAPDFSRIKEENLEELAKSRKDWGISCEWVVGTLGFEGRGYQTTFKASGYEICPGFEDFDYLRSYTPYAHKYGIKVISYLNMHWYSYEFAEKHLDWEQIMSPGQSYGRIHPLYGNGTTFCVNSPWRDWAFGLIKEAMKTGIDGVFLDGPVVFHDCCYCCYCQTKFREKYGKDIPKEDWRNPLWKIFMEFREDSLAYFLKDAQEAVREIIPDGVIFLNAGSWQPGGWRVARDIQKTGPFQDFNGAEAFFHYGRMQNIYASLMTGKYLRAGEKPSVVFTHYMNGLWHYLLLPAGEVNLAIVQTVASGANPWLALINSSLKSQPEGKKAVKEIFDFLEKKEEFYIQKESLAEAGILFSTKTARNYLSRFEGLYEKPGSGKEENLIVDQKGEKVIDWPRRKRQCEEILTSSYLGYFRILTRSHILFDVLLDQDLNEKKLSKYRVLILPDGACLAEESALAVKDFVKNGGSLIASFESGLYDGEGEFTRSLFELLGIDEVEGLFPVVSGENYIQATQDHLKFRKGSLIERGPYVLKVKPAKEVEMPFFFLNPVERVYTPLKGISSYPALLLNKYGEGKVAYFPEAIGYFLDQTGMISAEARVAGTVKSFITNPLLEVEAPKTISIEVYRQKSYSRILIHLVNNTIDGRPVNEFIPVKEIRLRLNLTEKPKKVFGLRENKRIVGSSTSEGFIIRLSVLHLYEIIVLEF